MAVPKKQRKRAAAPGGSEEGKIHRRQFVMGVRVGLKPEDREPLVTELTDKLTEMDVTIAEATEIAAGYRRKRKDLKEQVDELKLKLTQGIPEDTEVEEIKDFKRKTVTIVRLDTRAVVEKRDMTEEDMQLDLGGKADDEGNQEEVND